MTGSARGHVAVDTLPWLGICPLLAGADTFGHGLALGAVSAAVLVGTRLAATALRGPLPAASRLGRLMLVATALAVVLRLACEALDFDLALATGALFALTATQGALAGDDAGAAPALAAALRIAIPGAAALAAVGALREALGPASLLPATGFLIPAALAAMAALAAAVRRRRAGQP